jgi:protein-tyrosine phosphatase
MVPSAHPRNRSIALNGAFNMREVGGYTAGSGQTRWGKLYRSDSLHQLDAADREQLRALGIELVLDLRDDAERRLSPSLLDGLDLEHVHNPVLSSPASTFIAADASLNEFYDDIIDHSGDRIAGALRVLAGSGTRPVLVHCTAGKDRTGLVVALALDLSGVDRAEIVRDYAQTEQNLPSELLDAIVTRLRAEHVPGSVNLDELVRLSPAAVLERTFARIEELHGSVAAYATAHGLEQAEIAALREALLE